MEKEKILDKTNRGYDIFTHYLGKDVQRKLFVNPFRGDKSPSCRLYYNKRNGGIWIMKDYGASEWSGDCFSVVAKSMNINPMTDFRELLRTIDKDLDLFVMEEAPADYHPVQKVAPKPDEEGPISFKATYPLLQTSLRNMTSGVSINVSSSLKTKNPIPIMAVIWSRCTATLSTIVPVSRSIDLSLKPDSFMVAISPSLMCSDGTSFQRRVTPSLSPEVRKT